MKYDVILNGKKIGQTDPKHNAGDLIRIGFSSYEIQSVKDNDKQFLVDKW